MTGMNAQPQHGYVGYEYQKIATVWVALQLMFEENRCDSLTVEPASQEDIAANLAVPDALSRLAVQLPDIPVEIQIKTKGSNWTPASFRNILIAADPPATANPGPPPRPRALDLLKANPDLHYVFVTNAQLDPDLKGFAVARAGEKSHTQLDDEKTKDVDPAVWSRIGILPELSVERLKLEIAALLKKHGHVPHGRIAGCVRKLHDAVHLRLLGKAACSWSKLQVEEVMVAGGGVPESESAIVPPLNFTEMQEKLATGFAILLVGEPGVGKTEIARDLARQLRLEPEPFEKLSEAGLTPGAIADALDQPGAHVFLLEDPWGGDKLAEDAHLWTAELPKLMRRASAEKRFIVTSRESIRHEASRGARDPVLARAEFRLEAKHYSEELRWEIVTQRMAGAPSWQQDWAIRYRDRCLKELTVPLSLDHFCVQVKGAAKESDLDIEEVLKSSMVEALSRTCFREIAARGPAAIGGALILWALHHIHNHVTEEAAEESRTLVLAGGYRQESDPLKTLQWAVKSGWLKPAVAGFTAHPTTLTGIELFLTEERVLAETTLQCLLQGLSDAHRQEEAFRVLRHLSRHPRAITQAVRAGIEAHLVEVLLRSDGATAAQALAHITAYSKAEDPVTVLLRVLDQVDHRVAKLGFDRWQAGKLTGPQRAAILASPEAEKAGELFVSCVLPSTGAIRYTGRDLVKFFQQFGWDFGLQFQALTNVYLEQTDHSHAQLDVFVEGALCSKHPPIDDMLERALAADDAADAWYEKHKDERRAANQLEWDAAAASHFEEEMQELWVPRRQVLATVIQAKCRRDGFDWVRSHPRQSDLLYPWAEGMTPQTKTDELQELIDLCGNGRRPVAWHGIVKCEAVSRLPEIVGDLATCPMEDLDDCAEAAACLVPFSRWGEVVEAVRKLPVTRKVVIARARLFRADEEEERRAAIVAALSANEQTAITLLKDADPNKPTAAFGPAIAAILREVAMEGTVELAATAAFLLGQQDEEITSLLPRLAGATQERARLWVAFAAVLARRPVWDRAKVRSLVENEDYRLRRFAMQMLAKVATPEEQALIVAMKDDKSAPVRECCAVTIGHHRWKAGEAALASLLRDRRNHNPSPGFPRSYPDYHVARAAAAALLELEPLSRQTIDACLGLLRETEEEQDFELHCTVIHLLSSQQDERLLPLFASLLTDEWYVEAEKNSGFPRRYFAAWGLIGRIKAGNESGEDFDGSPIRYGAMHNDGRLAAPCLMLIAHLGEDASDLVLDVLGSPNMTEARAILLLLSLSPAATDLTAAVKARTGANHPVFALMGAPPFADESSWEQWLQANPATAAWLASIQSDEDVFPVVRWALGKKFAAFQPPQFLEEGLRDMLMPKPIGHLTLWSMFHE
jgi:hypothetical protein